MNQLILNRAIERMRKVVHNRLAYFDGQKLDDVWLGLRTANPDVTDKDIQAEIQRQLDDHKTRHWSHKMLSRVLPRITGKGPLR